MKLRQIKRQRDAIPRYLRDEAVQITAAREIPSAEIFCGRRDFGWLLDISAKLSAPTRRNAVAIRDRRLTGFRVNEAMRAIRKLRAWVEAA